MLKNPDVMKDLVHSEQAYKFLKNVRGSPAYWQHECLKVLAMVKSLGKPTWFLTLSAANLHWPEMIQAVALQLGKKVTKQEVLGMSIKQKSEFLKQNPVTAVCMF